MSLAAREATLQFFSKISPGNLEVIKKDFAFKWPHWKFENLVYVGTGISFHSIGFFHFYYTEDNSTASYQLRLANEELWRDDGIDYWGWGESWTKPPKTPEELVSEMKTAMIKRMRGELSVLEQSVVKLREVIDQLENQ